MTSFADITTIGVGGEITQFVEPTSRVGLIVVVEDADSHGLPLLVVGGGSNLLVADEPFTGVVVRDARRQISRFELEARTTSSGVPGTVGAFVVQNIGAYGQEVATSAESVEVWDRDTKTTRELTGAELAFGYRTSALKTSMYTAPRHPAARFFPTPRYVGAIRHLCAYTFAKWHGRIRSACSRTRC